MSVPHTQGGRPLGWHHPATRGECHWGAPHLGAVDVSQLPSEVMLGGLPPVYDQGQVGSCTANALAGAVEILHAHQGLADVRPDRVAIYYRERAMEGDTSDDAGAMIADGVTVVRSVGYSPERGYMPAWGSSWTTEPPALPADAPRVVNADPLPIDPHQVMFALAAGFPVVVGLSIVQAWEDLTGDTLPLPGDASIGGHALCLVGYRTQPTGVQFRVRNSWSEAWADGGYAWLPSEWIILACCGEAFALRAVRVLASDPSGEASA